MLKVDFSLTKNQGAYLNSTKTNTGFVAGLGSGKSFTATLKTILKKLQNPTLTVAYYLPNYSLVKDIAFAKFPEMLSEMGLKYKLNKSDKELFIDGVGGKIIFRSMDNPDSIVGYEVFYSIIDECDILKADKMEVAYNKIMARNRQKHPSGIKNQLDVVGTPEGFKWFHKRFVKDFNPNTDLLVRASTYENKHLPVEYITNLEQQYPPNLLKAYLNGEFVNLTSGAVYSYFDRQLCDTNIEHTENDILHIGLDFNWGGCCGSVFIIKDGLAILVDEFSAIDTRNIIIHLKKTYSNRKIIYPDASSNANKTNSSKSDMQQLREAGFRIDAPNKNPMIQDRINSVNSNLYNNTFLVNCSRCPESAEALEQQSYDEKTGLPQKFTGANTVDDRNDSIGYFINRKFGILKNKTTQTEFII